MLSKSAKLYAHDNTLVDIKDVICDDKYVYDRGNGNKSAYCHYDDGVEFWDAIPSRWRGWKLSQKLTGKREA